MKLLNQAFSDIYTTCPSATGPRKGKTKTLTTVSLKRVNDKNHDPIKLHFAVYFMASVLSMLCKLIYCPTRALREIKNFSDSP